MPFPTTPVVPRRTGGLEMFADVLEKNKTLPPRPVQHHPKEICLSPTRELPATLPAAMIGAKHTNTVVIVEKRTTTQPSTTQSSTTPGSNVQVVIRSRPQNKRERKKSEAIIVHTDEETHKVTVVQQRRDKLAKKIFTFDHVSGETSSGETSSGETSSGETSSGETSSGETSTQQDVYQKCVQPNVAEVLEGFNCTVFA